jgi:hypothetical protein
MEPSWMNQIASETVCGFFYLFFLFYTLLTGIVLAGTIGLLTSLKLPKDIQIAQAFYGLFMVTLAATQALFFYIICERGLKPGSNK